jgi:hypothetical protein
MIALAFGFFVILFVLPALALFLFTALDVLWRIDIGASKFFWLPLVLFVPVGGMLIYWLFRPKDFNPWLEKSSPFKSSRRASRFEPAPVSLGAREPAGITATGLRPALQGGADPESAAGPDPGATRRSSPPDA